MPKISRRHFLRFAGLSSFSLFSLGKNTGKNHPVPQTKMEILSSHDPWVELNLEHLAWNLAQIRRLVKVPVMAVIKANAYGHGLVEVGMHLEKCGIDYLMVGKLQEALALRKAGVTSPILNFGTFGQEEAEAVIENYITQSVFDESVSILNLAAQKRGKKAKVNIHVDTGMGRMGIPYQNAFPFIEKVSSMNHLLIKGISTTLTEDDDFDREQLARFLGLGEKAEAKGISLGRKHSASSDGIMDLASSYLDMVRPGIMLYGYYPSDKTQEEDRLSLKPVLQLKSRVVAVKTLRPGDTLSYHRKYTALEKEKIAVLPVGYSDGYPAEAVNKASVLIRGKRHPLIAAVTANHTIALLDRKSKVEVGDEVVFLGTQGGENISAVDIGRWADVSSYKVLIGLNPLLPRKIV